MDEIKTIREILSSYDEISNISDDGKIVFFELYNNTYGLLFLPLTDPLSRPIIFIKDDEQYDYPHIMLLEIPINGDNYRALCLYESGTQIEYIKTYEEKLIDAINRLFELLNLSPYEIEREFQNEFLFYWNAQAKEEVDVYIQSERTFHRMNVYRNKDGIFRFVSRKIALNDKSKYMHVPNLNVYYIPIIDNRGILPPLKNKLWNSKVILNIFKGRDYKRIDSETYKAIQTEKINQTEAIFIFEMLVDKQIITFGAKVRFKRSYHNTLLEKIEHSIDEIDYLGIKRCDYYFLNKQIGNETSIIGKKIAIVGAGSLGSYISVEMVKSGIKDLTLYDSDTVEGENILRHQSDFFWRGCSKVYSLQYKLQQIHPEVMVEIKTENITTKILKDDMNKFDMIIFAVGNSDVQLSCNNLLKKENYAKPVLYVWLEAGGSNSHILCVDYSQKGCFECLYTDEKGRLINNKVNRMTEEQVESHTLRNGCGATRVAYGSSILLRTTSVVLDMVQRVFNHEIKENILLNITRTSVTEQNGKFIESRCNCCGDPD